ncbi:MAG: hypothetical protein R3B84_07295 [Zavarzinella sp.]
MSEKAVQHDALAYSEKRHYWPFEVAGEDKKTEQDRLEIAFLQAAATGGGNAYVDGVGNFGAGNSLRSVKLIRRHSKKWEVRMFAGEDQVLSTSLESFKGASEVTLRWLKQGESDSSPDPTAN